jgi:hypothetical protein
MAVSYRGLLGVLVAYLTLVLLFHSQLPIFNEDRRQRVVSLATRAPAINTTRALPTPTTTLITPAAQQEDDPCGHQGDALGNDTHDFKPLGNAHFVYSAYYDDRQADAPSVRVIALLRKGEGARVSCRVQINGTEQHAAWATLYEMCENHAKDFGGWILSCRLPPAQPRPCSVTLALGDATTVLPLTSTTSADDPTREFGVCVPPLFGHIPSTTIVEFIELTQLLGAQHITFYVHEASAEMRRVLSFYTEDDERRAVRMLPWALPVPPRAVWYHGQLLAINDCLYRSMRSTRFVAFNDIDEFIVPQRHATWAALVQHLLRNASLSEISGFSFLSAFFDPMLLGGAGSRVLYDLESNLRTKHLSHVRTKAMVSPRGVFELGIHHISRALHDGLSAVEVDPDDAILHHYRRCVTDFDSRMNCQVFKTDTSLSAHIPTLRHNVHKTLWRLKERDAGHKAEIE